VRRLIRALLPPRGEHGAAAALFAVFLGTGVLLGMGAVVIDVGLLYHEKEQLQSGADFASWRVAQSCITNPALSNCNNTTQSGNARTYAIKNAKDDHADALACLNGSNCQLPWNTAVTCPPRPATTGTYDWVEVRTSTRTRTGDTRVPPMFSRMLLGDDYRGKNVGACARVAWGVPASATVLALGFSLCDWERITGRNSVFRALPGLDPLLQQTGIYSLLGLQPPLDSAVTISNPPLSICNNDWDHTSPSGYAWLGAPNASCQLTIAPTITPEYWIDSLKLTLTTLSTAVNCTNALAAARARGVPVLVPIFDRVQSFVTNLFPARYRIIGFAPFVVTGYTGLVGGLLGAVSSLSNTVPAIAQLLCGLQLCIYGYFTRSVLPAHMPTAFGNSRNLGVTVIGRTG
jgi:Flp pilus assembly protein TadG